MATSFLDSPLRRKVRASCPHNPGVYRWLHEGEPIYIGRSRSLRRRLLGYFRAPRGSKSAWIVAAADDLFWEETSSEFESHLVELRLIKEIRPSFNRALKEDHEYTFIQIGPGSAPRLLLTTEPTPYGPFRSPQRVEDIIRRLSDFLRLRTSPDTALLGSEVRRQPCLRGQLGRCMAPCTGVVDLAEYGQRIEKAKNFLLGREADLLEDLRFRMREAALRMEFERASVYRDRLWELEELSKMLGTLRESLEKLTFVYAVSGVDGQDRLYFIRGGRVLGVLPKVRGKRQVQRARELAFQLVEPILPPRCGDEMDEIRVIASWFRAHPRELLRTMSVEAFLAAPRQWPSDREGVSPSGNIPFPVNRIRRLGCSRNGHREKLCS